MNNEAGITEHWTITGKRVVLTGSGSIIRSIVLQLGLPLDSQIQLNGGHTAVALWGESLTRYVHQHCLCGDLPGNTAQADVLISAGIT